MDADLRAVSELSRLMSRYGSEIARRTVATALSRLATRTLALARSNVESKFVLRSPWTQGSLHRVFARPSAPIDRQRSQVGSYQAYMRLQETGGPLARTSPSGRGIATSYGAGESDGARPRRKLQRPRQARLRLHDSSAITGRMTGMQRAVVQIHAARRARARYVHVEFPGPRGAGTYRVTGGLGSRAKIRMVRGIVSRPMRVHASAWLEPAVDGVVRLAPAICVDEFARATTPRVLQPSARAARRAARGG